MVVAVATLSIAARPADAAKVVIAPGKTECVSADFDAAHFEVRRMGGLKPEKTRRPPRPPSCACAHDDSLS
jgi:hypothetical protein